MKWNQSRNIGLIFLNVFHFECRWGSSFLPSSSSLLLQTTSCQLSVRQYVSYGRHTAKFCKDWNITAFLTCDILKCWSLTNYMNLTDPFLLDSKGVCGLRESWVTILSKVWLFWRTKRWRIAQGLCPKQSHCLAGETKLRSAKQGWTVQAFIKLGHKGCGLNCKCCKNSKMRAFIEHRLRQSMDPHRWNLRWN